MSPSKLDPMQRARDHRVDSRQSRRARHAGGHHKLNKVFKDMTTVTYAIKHREEDTGWVTLDALPDITEEWIEKRVYVRSPVGGEPDRLFLGVQLPDDTLAWIELSLMSPAPPTTGGAPGAPVYTWATHIGVGKLDLELLAPAGLDTDGSGNIWIGSPRDSPGKLKKFSPAGAQLVSITLPHPISTAAYICGLAVQQSDGDVWAGDTLNERVHHYNTSGVDQTAWQPTGLDDALGVAFNAAESIIAVADGEVSTHRVRFYTFPALTLITTLTSFANLVGVDFDSTGNIYLSDWQRHVVYQYSSTYVLLDTWGTVNVSGAGNGEFNHPYGVHVDAVDRVYVADGYNHRVQVFQTDGTFLTSFGTVGSGNGKFRYPGDITTFGSNVYVSEMGNDRISAWTVS